jgi:hypothetical protein|tara:strand:- start:174 stop:404 length:231 start_codon:yes stop_codon:yes gene_type:complete
MGKSFKLTNKTHYKKAEKVEEEVKVVYDHRPKVKTNPKIIEEFKKNMKTPSPLWDGPVSFNVDLSKDYQPFNEIEC